MRLRSSLPLLLLLWFLGAASVARAAEFLHDAGLVGEPLQPGPTGIRSLYVPDVPHVRATVLLGQAPNVDWWFRDPLLREMCARAGTALAIVTLAALDNADDTPVVLERMAELAALPRIERPELAHAPFVVVGFGARGVWAGYFSLAVPERVVAYLRFNAAWRTNYPRAEQYRRLSGIPHFELCGTHDNAWDDQIPWALRARSLGGLTTPTAAPGHGHDTSPESTLYFHHAVPWIEAVLGLRLPPAGAPWTVPPALNSLVAETGYLGQWDWPSEVAPFSDTPPRNATFRTVPGAEGLQRRAVAWLPSEEVARSWRLYNLGRLAKGQRGLLTQRPTVEIEGIEDRSRVGNSIDLAVRAEDADGRITRVYFFVDGVEIYGVDVQQPRFTGRFTFAGLPRGWRSIAVRAYDDAGAFGTDWRWVRVGR